MVKQQVWIANSALVLLILLSFGVRMLLQQPIPVQRTRKTKTDSDEPRYLQIPVNLERIYTSDVFGTYDAPPEKGPTQKNLVTPIPTLNVAASKPPPPLKKPAMLTPLSITVKGIIMSHDVSKSIAMVADQTNKESIYHVGDKVQDGQIIKITTNKIIVLRSNGQLETFYLRKPEKLKPGLALWEYAIKKIDDGAYHVDPAELSKAISSVGELVEALNLSAEYNGDTPIGIRLDTIAHHPLGKQLGLAEGDIITSINSLPTTGTKELIRAYDELSLLPLDSRLEVAFSRGEQQKTIAYMLKKLRKPSPFEAAAASSGTDEDQSSEEHIFKLGKDAQRREKRRQFAHDHRTAEQRASARGDMRKRLLENMRNRAPNRRVR